MRFALLLLALSACEDSSVRGCIKACGDAGVASIDFYNSVCLCYRPEEHAR